MTSLRRAVRITVDAAPAIKRAVAEIGFVSQKSLGRFRVESAPGTQMDLKSSLSLVKRKQICR
jgi:hypothetical protein